MFSIKKTKDGSSTIFSTKYNAHFHSLHGALTESQHIFIDQGYKYYKHQNQIPATQTINILEIGFGSGLNAWLTFVEAMKDKQKIHYFALEPDPIPEEIYQNLGYTDLLKSTEELKKAFFILHKSKWTENHKLSTEFTFIKLKEKIQEHKALHPYHIIYYDAFAPENQSELWNENVFIKLKESMASGGIIVTYCAKGNFKRMLRKIGFKVESIQGPPGGKREITRILM